MVIEGMKVASTTEKILHMRQQVRPSKVISMFNVTLKIPTKEGNEIKANQTFSNKCIFLILLLYINANTMNIQAT